MEAMGKALVVEPYLATVVLGGGFLRHGGSEAQRQAHVPSIIDGSKTFAFAQLEKNSRYDLGDVATTAKKKGAGYVISGEKFVVANGDSADTLRRHRAHRRRPARPQGRRRLPRAGERQGRARKGLSDPGRPARGEGVASSRSRSAPMPCWAMPRTACRWSSGWSTRRDRACSEAVGAMDESLKTTMDYLKTRQQFGQNIGKFQALQHRGSDMFVALEQARGIAMYGTMAVDLRRRHERRRRSRRRRCRSAAPANSSASSRSSCMAASA